MAIYENVKKLCDLKGISMLKMENAIGISPGASSKWRKSTPNCEVLLKIADYFDVTADVVLGREDVQKNNSTAADAALKMMYDPELTDLVNKVCSLNQKQRELVSQFLNALTD